MICMTSSHWLVEWKNFSFNPERDLIGVMAGDDQRARA